ncbi:DNA cytosine methyltransferase [Rhizobium metallidurans]|uniref:Cytosine-specific methyltransferase n=1 Tax=Rhizobium metallidurans TaxID=1265931 RepID=A0A7W6CR83_9HYPH|nr:DNA (cytosine-5-)-methyltransferase [Rhizobium metallidurans]MBB3965732.1 DNA (cytosine-5)-methyltransferase 1 [Rhizobium metallidurans]
MKAFELFAGAGGMSLGLKNAGFELVGAFDAWKLATENYNTNVGPHAEVFDLKDVAGAVVEIARRSPDIIVGGPPCQDYSLAGKREEQANASLTKSFSMIVSGVRPEWFLMENVIQVLTSDTWMVAKEVLKVAGFGISILKADCSFYGVPQSRRRCFVVGRRGECDGFLDKALERAASDRPMTLRDLFGAAVPEALYFPARMPSKRSVWGPDEPAPTIRSSSLRPVPANYMPHDEDAALIENGYVYTRPFRGGRGVRSVDEPMSTITRTSFERPTGRYLNAQNEKDPVSAADTAVLTLSQISRIQGFPADWRWLAKSKRDICQMIANAVPAPVAARLGKVIMDWHRGESGAEIIDGFVDWVVLKGRSRSSGYNVKSSLRRARKLLGNRIFDNVEMEIAALQQLAGFVSLPVASKSDIRQALRLYTAFLNETPKVKKKGRLRKTPAGNDNLSAALVDVDDTDADFGT